MINITPEIRQLIDDGAVFFVSHSGGKDSQEMYAELKKIIPFHQLVVVHANLGEVEWPGVEEHIWDTVKPHAVNVVRAGKTFLEMVERRGMWPSSKNRQCTSDLKRGPIFKFIGQYMRDRGLTLGVNCMGIRAEESAARAKKNPFELNTMYTNTRRTIYNWMPIFDMTTAEVFQGIADAGQKPFWAYERNERLSCVFCILGCANDLRHGAEANPELYRKYVELERRIGHTMFSSGGRQISLEERTGIPVGN